VIPKGESWDGPELLNWVVINDTTVRVQSYEWWYENQNDIKDWLKSEHLLKFNLGDWTKLEFETEAQLAYFILRWSK